MDLSADESPPLSNAPIQEAILDVRTTNNDSFSPEVIKERLPLDVPEFNRIEERIEGKVKLHLEKGKQLSAEKPNAETAALIFRNTENTEAIQLRRNGFGFSRLKPYENWGNFYSGFVENWNKCERFVLGKEINRIGVRYINALPISSGQIDLSDLFLLRPEYPDNLGGAANNIFLKLSFQEKGANGQHINSNLILRSGNTMDGNPTFILDIDVSAICNCHPLDKDFEKFTLELRTIKNRIFKNSLTPQYYDTFK